MMRKSNRASLTSRAALLLLQGVALLVCHACDHRGAVAGAIAFLGSDRPDGQRAGDAYGDRALVRWWIADE
jgi:hypothetical protein